MSSSLNSSIEVNTVGTGEHEVLIVGGVHGDEIEGVATCLEILNRLTKRESSLTRKVTIIPCLNPDGFALKQRSNANDVDLNRNLPTSNWRAEATNQRYKPGASAASEKETRFFLEVVGRVRPKLIISIHSFSESLLLFPTNEFNEPYLPSVQKMSAAMAIPIVEKMNYEIFGSLSRWGLENGIATLTIELLKGQNLEKQISTCADQVIDLFIR